MNTPTTFGDRLKSLMDEKGWKPEELAVKIGVSTAMVYIYFNKKEMPNTKKIQAFLKREVDIDADYIIYGDKKELENILEVTEANDSKVEFSNKLDLYNILNLVEEVKRLRERVELLEHQIHKLQNQKQ